MKKFLLPIAVVALTFVSCKDSSGDASEDDIKEAKEVCIKEAKSSMAGNMDMFDEDQMNTVIEDYCGCAMDAIVEEDIPVSDMKTMSESDIMEIAGDCLEEFQENLMKAMK